MAAREAPEEHRSVAAGARKPVFRMRPPPLENGDRLTRLEFEMRYWPGTSRRYWLCVARRDRNGGACQVCRAVATMIGASPSVSGEECYQ